MNTNTIMEPIKYSVGSSGPDFAFVVYSSPDSTKPEPKEVKSEAETKVNTVDEMIRKSHPKAKNLGLLQPTDTQRLHHFLEDAIRSKGLSSNTASMAMKAWLAMAKLSANKLATPDAGVNPDGELLYTWNMREHHFELEIFPNGVGEFFYLNRQTGDVWEYEYQIENPIPEEVVEKLDLFSYD